MGSDSAGRLQKNCGQSRGLKLHSFICTSNQKMYLGHLGCQIMIWTCLAALTSMCQNLRQGPLRSLTARRVTVKSWRHPCAVFYILSCLVITIEEASFRE